MKPEDFYKKYKDHVLKWITIKNNENRKYEINPEDFFSDIIDKLYTRNAIATYEENHYSGASFETWLEYVLSSVYNDSIRKVRKHSWRNLGIDDTESEQYYKNTIKIDRLEKLLLDENEYEVQSLDMNCINSLIDNIKSLKQRVLVKLKFYIEEKVVFCQEEINFMAVAGNLESDEVMNHIRSVAKPKMGLKDKDLPKLTSYRAGSVNATFQRIVRKEIIEPYKRIKANE